MDDAGSSLKSQIYNEMRLKDTQSLLEIWRENDRETWTDEAFDVVEALLMERLGFVPGQGNSRGMALEKADITVIDDEQEEEWIEPEDEEDDDEDETYHDPIKLTRIATWSRTLSWLVLISSILDVIRKSTLYSMLRLAFLGYENPYPPPSGVSIIQLIYIFLVGIFYFVVLQAISQGIYLLMDIYDNTCPD